MMVFIRENFTCKKVIRDYLAVLFEFDSPSDVTQIGSWPLPAIDRMITRAEITSEEISRLELYTE
jgi:hypothetical protein